MALTWIEEVQIAAERNTKRRLEEVKADKVGAEAPAEAAPASEEVGKKGAPKTAK
jgi:hypothetical protein